MRGVIRRMLTIGMGVGLVAPCMYAGAQSRFAGTVFVMSNNAERNQVIEFRPTAGGNYAEQRFDTLGRGSGGVNDPLEAQGSLTLSNDGSFLFAANAGSGDITVFRVVNGALFIADKEPSGGSQPVSIAQLGDRVYVLNSGGAGSVVGFTVDGGGHLRQIANSTAFLSANATGGASISISPDGQFVAVVERVAGNIDTFRIQPDGTLGAVVVNPSPAPGAFDGRFAPDGKLIVSETGPAGASNASAISSYTVQPNGTLVAVSQSVPTDGAANCWNAITPDGTRVYVSNAGSSDIAGFTIGQTGQLKPIASTVVGANPAGSTNLDIAISSNGKFLFTLNGEVGTIGVFGIQSDGTLQEIDEIPGLPKASGFNGIAAL
ncbi:MAG TPA: beta-propeller fold lactonase family protein [Terracidiphilus sp.]|nr:beta-propeller fold lactonase family protein [Terracidiphilus sp.]